MSALIPNQLEISVKADGYSMKVFSNGHLLAKHQYQLKKEEKELVGLADDNVEGSIQTAIDLVSNIEELNLSHLSALMARFEGVTQ